MTKDEQLKLLNDLISDIDCLEPLYRWTNDINIFNVLKLNRVEIRHSNMLAWLLNPNELHGLEDKLLKKFLIYATKGTNLEIMKGLKPVDIDLMDFNDTIVYREKNNIDLLIVSESNHLVLAIENKIGSTEHSNQLEKYKTSLLKDYSEDYKFVLIYLTPSGEESSDLDNWVNMSYDFVLEELKNLIDIYKIPDRARIYIEDYIKAIRRNIVEDKEIVDICKKIYFNHKEAFDLIFDNKPDLISHISDYIYNYLVENSDNFDINVWDNHTKHYVRFTPNKLTAVCGHMGSGWVSNQSNLIGFEFQISEDSGVNLAVIIGPADTQYEDYRQKVFDVAVKHNYKMKGKTLNNKWKTILSTNFVPKNKLDITDDYMKHTVEVPIDNYMNKDLPTIVSDLLEAF